ncbi:extracellular solute-binding protein [Pseudomonas sp. BN417]|uniref:extracellular solute-binding protein n=1 Tax=Pseudomonas sp. BN417 TaxID=2567890 RepID=UPI0024543AE5|nr:extracellular solute-binding protein [Pseudomonas sp. BN417]MDH4556236.1 extracellular solute-binding protein [Pseudomonas sp. BN417]
MDLGTKEQSLSKGARLPCYDHWGTPACIRLLLSIWLTLMALQVSAADVVRVHNWAEYIDPEVLRDFERDTGVKVEYSQFATAAELEADLASGKLFDVIVPTDFQLERLIKAHKLLELDRTKLPNRAEVSDELLAKLSSKNRADRYVAPYMWGIAGLVIHERAAARALQAPVANSWSLLFDPASASRLKSCGAVLHNEPEQTLSLYLNYRGRNLRSQSARGIEKATREISDLGIPLGPASFTDLVSQLAEGRICAAITWNGIASMANQKGELRFHIPQEGGLMFIDSLAIPSNAPSKALAYRFIDYMLQPGNAARNARATHFTPSLDLTRERNRRLLPEITLPSQEEKRRLFFLERLSDSQKRAVDAAWSHLDGRDPT